jgi:hypothetical protein
VEQDGNEILTLDTDSAGRIYPKSQATDYMLRGEELKGYNIIEFFVNTYEDDMERRYLEENEEESTEPASDEHRGPGRRRNARYLYLPNHPKFTKKLRIK